MADDLSMAQGLLGGNPRISKRFARRFRDRLSTVLEYCREARALGLSSDQWTEGVAWRAAEAYVQSIPLQGFSGQSLAPFVERVLKHRDVAIVIVLGSGGEPAWVRFQSLYQDYILSLFLRQGRTAFQAHEGTVALMQMLREPCSKTGRLRIESYSGRCELVIWLIAQVRLATHEKQLSASNSSAIVPRSLRLGDAEDAGVLEVWLALSEAERAALTALASGERFGEKDGVLAKGARKDVLRGLGRIEAALVRVDDTTPDLQLMMRLQADLDGRLDGFFGKGGAHSV